MNWEKSKAITPIKRDFLKAFFSREKRFFLTGGSALGLFYLEHRFSYDLDLFSKEHVDWLEIDGLVRLCSQELGASLQLLRDAPTFRRYCLEREGGKEIVDIVVDISPQVDQEKQWIDNIQVDTLREIMLNKITTLISRCEVKDIVDLYFLEQEGFVVEECFEDAQLKDGGLDPSMISLILDSLKITELPAYMIKPLTISELRDYVVRLKNRMALLALPSLL